MQPAQMRENMHESLLTTGTYRTLYICWVCLCFSCLRNSYFSVTSKKCNHSFFKNATTTSCTFLTEGAIVFFFKVQLMHIV
jgi:hypothetical protein